MKAFVTGGSGFVGRHMIQMLCDRLKITAHSCSDRLQQTSSRWIVDEIALLNFSSSLVYWLPNGNYFTLVSLVFKILQSNLFLEKFQRNFHVQSICICQNLT
jgi:UDP-glucose 4-epimerase